MDVDCVFSTLRPLILDGSDPSGPIQRGAKVALIDGFPRNMMHYRAAVQEGCLPWPGMVPVFEAGADVAKARVVGRRAGDADRADGEVWQRRYEDCLEEGAGVARAFEREEVCPVVKVRRGEGLSGP